MRFTRILVTGLLLGSTIAVSTAQRADADAGRVLTWTGAVDANWGTAGNWLTSGNQPAVPAKGDSLVFADGGNSTSTNNLTNLSLAGILINGSGVDGPYDIDGQALTIGATGIATSSGASATVTAPIRLGVAATQLSANGVSGGQLTIGAVSLAGYALSLRAAPGEAVLMQGVISGNGSVSTSGFVQLDGANTYTGPTAVLSGFTYLGNGKALGAVSSTSATTVAHGAILDATSGPFTSPIASAEPITLNGATIEGDGVFSGAVHLVGTSTIAVSQRSSFGIGFLKFTGPMSGSGALVITGWLGEVTLQGTKTYSGPTDIVGPSDPGDISSPVLLSVSAGPLAGSVDVTGYSTSFRPTGAVKGAVHIESPTQILPPNVVSVGGLTLDPGGSMSVTVGGSTHEQLQSSGTVLLGGSLIVNKARSLAPHTVVTVIRNNSGQPVQGIFDGLPEGSVVAGMTLSYHGNGRADVTLTQL